MKFVFLALIFVPPLLAGLGYIPSHWIIGSLIFVYFRSILVVADETDVSSEFRVMGTDEFMKWEKAINLKRLRYVVVIALVHGFGRLVLYLL